MPLRVRQWGAVVFIRWTFELVGFRIASTVPPPGTSHTQFEPSKQNPITFPQRFSGPEVTRSFALSRGAPIRSATPAMLRPSTIVAVFGGAARAADGAMAAAHSATAARCEVRMGAILRSVRDDRLNRLNRLPRGRYGTGAGGTARGKASS